MAVDGAHFVKSLTALHTKGGKRRNLEMIPVSFFWRHILQNEAEFLKKSSCIVTVIFLSVMYMYLWPLLSSMAQGSTFSQMGILKFMRHCRIGKIFLGQIDANNLHNRSLNIRLLIFFVVFVLSDFPHSEFRRR